MIATDLDGTFLDNDQNIPKENMQAVDWLRKNGYIFIIMTGRSQEHAEQYLKMTDYKELCGIFQGAVVLDAATGNIVSQNALDTDTALSIYHDAVSLGLNVQAYKDNHVWVEKYDENIAFEEKVSRHKIGICKDLEALIASNDNIKLLINTSEALTQKYFTYFRDKYPELSVATSGPRFTEFTRRDAHKGTALDIIAKHYGVKPEEIMAFGDQLNDIPLLDYAGFGVAVANAKDELKKHAKYITSSNSEAGFAKAIEKFIINADKGETYV